MPSGKITRFESQRGFGFVRPDCGGAEVFVHRSMLKEVVGHDLGPGDRVSFETRLDHWAGKQEAYDVKVLGRDATIP